MHTFYVFIVLFIILKFYIKLILRIIYVLNSKIVFYNILIQISIIK